MWILVTFRYESLYFFYDFYSNKNVTFIEYDLYAVHHSAAASNSCSFAFVAWIIFPAVKAFLTDIGLFDFCKSTIIVGRVLNNTGRSLRLILSIQCSLCEKTELVKNNQSPHGSSEVKADCSGRAWPAQ